MKLEIKEKWVEALRSGDYKQGKSQLAFNDKYCCLGVLCELAFQEGIVEKTKTDESNSTYYDNDWAYLPKKVMAWSGIRNNSGAPLSGTALSVLNDEENYTFDQIADVIDLKWENL